MNVKSASSRRDLIKNLKRCLIKGPQNECKKHLIKNLQKMFKKVPCQGSLIKNLKAADKASLKEY